MEMGILSLANHWMNDEKLETAERFWKAKKSKKKKKSKGPTL